MLFPTPIGPDRKTFTAPVYRASAAHAKLEAVESIPPKHPRRVFPGFVCGLLAGIWIIWSYTKELSPWTSDETLRLLWIRVPTFSAGLGTLLSVGLSEVVGRWEKRGRPTAFLLVAVTLLVATLSIVFTNIGGSYFGSLRLPYVGGTRLAIGVVSVLFLSGYSLGRQQKVSRSFAAVSTVIWTALIPVLSMLLASPWLSYTHIRALARQVGHTLTFSFFGGIVGVACGLCIAMHIMMCAKSSGAGPAR